MPEAAPLAEAPAAQAEQPVAPPDADILAQLEQAGGQTPPAADAPPAETAKDPEPQTPKESALVRSIQMRERRLIADRERDRNERQQWEQSFEQRVHRRVEEEVGKILADSKLVEQRQKTPDELAREEAARALEEAKSGKTELQRYLAEQSRQKAESDYLATARKMESDLPHLFDEWDERELVTETHKLVAELREECRLKNRPMPTGNIDAKLLRLLDKRAKARQDSRQERQKARGADVTKKATPQGDPKADANGSGHQGERAGASATTTLGKGLGERQTMQAPDPVLMSDAEVIARSEDALKKGLVIRPR